MANGNEGSTPALGDAQARKLLEAPPGDKLKGVRDRAILATLLYHGIRREELCRLRVRDIQSRQGVVHFRIKGKRDKIRFVPVHATAQRLIDEYQTLVGHREDAAGSLFRPVKNNVTGELDRPLNPNSVYRNIVQKYGLETRVSAQVNGLCVHSLRATAATNPSPMRPTLPKSRSGWDTPTFPPRGFTTGARRDQRIVQRSGCDTS
jgi:integrase/recombinase XerD